MYIFALNGLTRTLVPLYGQGQVGDLVVLDGACLQKEHPSAGAFFDFPQDPVTLQITRSDEDAYALQNIGANLSYVLEKHLVGPHLYLANQWLVYTQHLVQVTKEATAADIMFPSTRVCVEVSE